tara:strand:- start:133 stop:375 length:243 start_codon:yes stop_codon:yes gene_type:complete
MPDKKRYKGYNPIKIGKQFYKDVKKSAKAKFVDEPAYRKKMKAERKQEIKEGKIYTPPNKRKKDYKKGGKIRNMFTEQYD